MKLSDLKSTNNNVVETTEQMKILLYNYKKGLLKKKAIVPLKQPIVFLLRRNKRIEIHHPNRRNQIDSSLFKYTHSNGKEYEVKLTDANIYSAPYGDTSFKAYIHHEDHASTFPFNPIFEIQRYKADIQNSQSSEMKWKTEEQKAKTGQLWAIAGIIGVIVAGVILYKLMIEPTPTQVIIPASSDVIKNVTAVLGN